MLVLFFTSNIGYLWYKRYRLRPRCAHRARLAADLIPERPAGGHCLERVMHFKPDIEFPNVPPGQLPTAFKVRDTL